MSEEPEETEPEEPEEKKQASIDEEETKRQPHDSVVKLSLSERRVALELFDKGPRRNNLTFSGWNWDIWQGARRAHSVLCNRRATLSIMSQLRLRC